MKLQFCGANRMVTGSCHLLETSGKKILVDCGMFQGSNFSVGRNYDAFPFDPQDIHAVLVTHAHIDHIGRIPKLIKEGFSGEIYMTKATCDLAKVMWEDTFNIMKYDNKKHGVPILFDLDDVQEAASRCSGVDYEETVSIAQGITAVFKDMGHIFGSSFIEVTSEGKTIAFSGDVGNDDAPIIKDTTQLGEIDYLVCESTYGNRVHEDKRTRRDILLGLIKEAASKGGTIMIPAFSLERTQELLYELNILVEKEKSLEPLKMFVDSPLAIKTIEIMKKYPEYYDHDAECLKKAGDDFLQFPGLELTPNKEDSIRINDIKGPKVVIAGAGMMNGGRILHHALRYLPDPNSTLIIVGYQADGTLGRRLYEGHKKVKIYGNDVEVNCTIKAIGALSGHGDQEKIIRWISGAKKTPFEVYFVHGEPDSATTLAHKVRDELGIQTFVPEYEEVIELN